MVKRTKAQITRIRESLSIVLILIFFGVAAVIGIRFGLSEADPAAAAAMRVELWCTGYAAGRTQVMTMAGFQPPYSNEWERMIQGCHDDVTYLDPYNVQKGISPLNPSEVLWQDVAPPADEFCIPSILRQC